jgi:hypothetical protein
MGPEFANQYWDSVGRLLSEEKLGEGDGEIAPEGGIIQPHG